MKIYQELNQMVEDQANNSEHAQRMKEDITLYFEGRKSWLDLDSTCQYILDQWQEGVLS